MKKGYRVIDMDTHVGPSFDVLCEYVDPSFRPRLPELEKYRQKDGVNIAVAPYQWTSLRWAEAGHETGDHPRRSGRLVCQ